MTGSKTKSKLTCIKCGAEYLDDTGMDLFRENARLKSEIADLLLTIETLKRLKDKS